NAQSSPNHGIHYCPSLRALGTCAPWRQFTQREPHRTALRLPNKQWPHSVELGCRSACTGVRGTKPRIVVEGPAWALGELTMLSAKLISFSSLLLLAFACGPGASSGAAPPEERPGTRTLPVISWDFEYGLRGWT